MKVFKMLHLNILNTAIIRDMGTFHEVKKCLPSTRQMVFNGLLNQKHDIEDYNENINSLEMTTIIAQVKTIDLKDLIDQIFHDIKTTSIEILVLQLHLLSGLKVLKGKQ